MRFILSIFFLVVFSSQMQGQERILAFPGAEGFGRYATGGRHGEVYRVTNLDDSGSGSLRDAVSQPNRMVIFDVSGVIKISSRLVFSPNLTIAGQTAPGGGITVYGDAVSFTDANNTICQYIRFRMGKGGESGKDAVTIADGDNMIFDHISVSWGKDENFSVSGSRRTPSNITLQNSIIAQGLEGHSCGGLIQTSGGVTLYRNLYIDNNTRNPKVKGLNQFVNNVVYNWGVGAYILGGSASTSWATIEDNYFIKGPSTKVEPYTRANQNFQLYARGNYYDENRNGLLDGTESKKEDYGDALWVESPEFWETSTPRIPKMHPAIKEQMTPQEAYLWIKEKAGASFPYRDAVDNYLIEELISLGTKGTTIADESELGLPGKVGTLPTATKPLDTDNDGIPDEWEVKLGTNPNADDAMAIGADGYTNIERYIHQLTK